MLPFASRRSSIEPSPPASARDLLTPIAAEIDVANLRHNVRQLRQRAGAAEVMGVIKADAYGHGAARLVPVLQEEGINHFAVARVPEPLALREGGLDAPILVFEAPLPAHLPAYARHRLDVTVPSRAVAEAVVAAAAGAEHPLRIHVKVDTGMGRLGLAPKEAAEVLRLLQDAPGVTLAGLWTHFATAGNPGGEAFAQEQLRRFRAVARAAPAGTCLHTANTGALLTFEDSFRSFSSTFARIGVALFGLAGSERLAEEAGLRPVMRLTSRVTQVKTVGAGTSISYGRTWRARETTRIATVGAGYADGYHRLLSNRAEVGIRGRRFPVVGTICMDMLMVDLGPPGGSGDAVCTGDEVVLFGPGGPSAFEVARWAETIPYEICCAVAQRVPRRYQGAPRRRV